MRFAGERIIPSEAQNPDVIPNTEGIKYPQDKVPAGNFGRDGVHPTELPLMKHNYMQSPRGGIAFTAPFTPVKQYEDGKTRPYHPQNPNRQA